jgi:hypothetical protein
MSEQPAAVSRSVHCGIAHVGDSVMDNDASITRPAGLGQAWGLH